MNPSQRLPWDFSRCQGLDCPRRDSCLRHEQLSNMGPRTPFFDHCFVDEPGGVTTYPYYIPMKADE